MVVWCRGLHGKRDCHEILKKAWVEISLGGTRNHGDGIMVSVVSFMLSVFVVWLCLIASLLCLVHGLATLFAELYCYWFSWFSSYLFPVLPLMFWVLGKWKLMEFKESCVAPNRWCKVLMKLIACIRAVEGKRMTVSWIGWVHWGKWMVIWQSWER